jgi:hypothetical protein
MCNITTIQKAALISPLALPYSVNCLEKLLISCLNDMADSAALKLLCDYLDMTYEEWGGYTALSVAGKKLLCYINSLDLSSDADVKTIQSMMRRLFSLSITTEIRCFNEVYRTSNPLRSTQINWGQDGFGSYTTHE